MRQPAQREATCALSNIKTRLDMDAEYLRKEHGSTSPPVYGARQLITVHTNYEHLPGELGPSLCNVSPGSGQIAQFLRHTAEFGRRSASTRLLQRGNTPRDAVLCTRVGRRVILAAYSPCDPADLSL